MSGESPSLRHQISAWKFGQGVFPPCYSHKWEGLQLPPCFPALWLMEWEGWLTRLLSHKHKGEGTQEPCDPGPANTYLCSCGQSQMDKKLTEKKEGGQ